MIDVGELRENRTIVAFSGISIEVGTVAIEVRVRRLRPWRIGASRLRPKIGASRYKADFEPAL